MKKYVLITGASGQLAKSLIKKFNKKNYIVIGISKKKINDDKNIYINLDLLKKNAIKKLFDKLKEKNIFPNIIIHNLGGKVKNDLHPLSSKIIKESIHLNLGVSVDLNSKFMEEALKNNLRLNIIHISSDASETGQSSPAYAASKSAINAYVKSTARMYIKKKIYLCAVLPTKFTSSKKQRVNLDLFPLDRLLHTSEVSKFIINIVLVNNPSISGSLFTLDASKI